MSSPVGRLELFALDCPDPRALAEFYRALVGGEIDPRSDDEWTVLATPEGHLGFQRIDDHQRPTWPTGAVPQQAHADILVDDLDRGEAAAIELGAEKAAVQPSPAEFRVFLDPVGHPFCLVLDDGD